MNNESIPKSEDWGLEPDKDEFEKISARLDFYGKSSLDVHHQFIHNPIELAYSLRHIPPKPFKFYMLVFCDAISGDFVDGDDAADLASNFLELILDTLSNDPNKILSIMERVFSVAQYVGERQTEWDADEEIYGNFVAKVNFIENKWMKLTI